MFSYKSYLILSLVLQFWYCSAFFIPTGLPYLKNFHRLFSTTATESSSDDIKDIKVSPKEFFTTISSSSQSCDRALINEKIVLLEKLCTNEPAKSPLINGVWEVLNTNGFTSPGLLAYQAIKLFGRNAVDLSCITVTISRDQPRVNAETSVKLASLNTKLSVQSNLSVVGDFRLKEEVVSAKLNEKELNLNPLSSMGVLDKVGRSLIVTYVDDDLLIVRDQLGAADVLRRKEYQPKYEGETSVSDDGAPGV